MMKLANYKKITIQIEDNTHCHSGCPFMGERAVDFCVLFDNKEIKEDRIGFIRLDECQSFFGHIQDGFVYHDTGAVTPLKDMS